METSLVDGLLGLGRETGLPHPSHTAGPTVWEAGDHLTGSNTGWRLGANQIAWDRLLDTFMDLFQVWHTLVVEDTGILLLIGRESLREVLVEALKLTDELLTLAELLLVAAGELSVL